MLALHRRNAFHEDTPKAIHLSGGGTKHSGNYIFLLASGFLCDPGDSSTCSATAKANPSEDYELSGAGRFGGYWTSG
jgi:hypothetical protein